jgi:hypothetical protein
MPDRGAAPSQPPRLGNQEKARKIKGGAPKYAIKLRRIPLVYYVAMAYILRVTPGPTARLFQEILMVASPLYERLEAAVPALSAKDAEFAKGLLSSAAKYGRSFSPKMAFWGEKLVARAAAPKGESVAEVGDLGGLLALFDKAKGKLKYPAIVVSVPGVPGGAVRLNVAGAKAKVPGSINVASVEKSEPGEFGNLRRAWYGRVSPAGKFAASGKGEEFFGALAGALMRLARSPAEVAAEYGRLNGACCFCSLKLEDERSVAVGYGPVCAKNWGLPWGAEKFSFKAEAA